MVQFTGFGVGVDLNHRSLGYEPSTLSLIWRNLTPFWPENSLLVGPDFGPKFVRRSSSWIDVELSGSAGVLAHFPFARPLFRATLGFLVQLVGLPLFFIGFVRFLDKPTVSRYFR